MALFLDRDSLDWGDDWTERIARAVNEAAFFIPVLSPRYFRSEACREEFRAFVAKARQLGTTDRVLGIVYIRIPDMSIDSTDELVAWAARYQHRELLELRWLAADSDNFRRQANALAQELVDLENSRAPRIALPGEDASRTGPVFSLPAAPTTATQIPAIVGDAYLELVATAGEALPTITSHLQRCTVAAKKIRNMIRDYVVAVIQIGNPSAKLAILTRLVDLTGDAEQDLTENAREFTSAVEDVDTGVQAVLHWPISTFQTGDLDGREALVSQLACLNEHSTTARQELAALHQVMDEAATTAKVARNTFRNIETSILKLTDGQMIVDRWKFQTPSEDNETR
ncbi:hypothetical protein GCM10027097_39200 [Amycolatopsis acidiphila]